MVFFTLGFKGRDLRGLAQGLGRVQAAFLWWSGPRAAGQDLGPLTAASRPGAAGVQSQTRQPKGQRSAATAPNPTPTGQMQSRVGMSSREVVCRVGV